MARLPIQPGDRIRWIGSSPGGIYTVADTDGNLVDDEGYTYTHGAGYQPYNHWSQFRDVDWEFEDSFIQWVRDVRKEAGKEITSQQS